MLGAEHSPQSSLKKEGLPKGVLNVLKHTLNFWRRAARTLMMHQAWRTAWHQPFLNQFLLLCVIENFANLCIYFMLLRCKQRYLQCFCTLVLHYRFFSYNSQPGKAVFWILLLCTSLNKAAFLAASASGKKKFPKDINCGNIIKSNQVNRNKLSSPIPTPFPHSYSLKSK